MSTNVDIQNIYKIKESYTSITGKIFKLFFYDKKGKKVAETIGTIDRYGRFINQERFGLNDSNYETLLGLYFDKRFVSKSETNTALYLSEILAPSSQFGLEAYEPPILTDELFNYLRCAIDILTDCMLDISGTTIEVIKFFLYKTDADLIICACALDPITFDINNPIYHKSLSMNKLRLKDDIKKLIDIMELNVKYDITDEVMEQYNL